MRSVFAALYGRHYQHTPRYRSCEVGLPMAAGFPVWH